MRHFYIIETRYHGPTNYKGARVSAKRADGYGRRVTVPYAHEKSAGENHETVARILLADFDRHELVGSAETERGYAFVADPLGFYRSGDEA